MATLNALNLNIAGFAAVNRDLTVQVRDAVSREVVKTATPFSDGTVRIPQIAAGAYELAVLHPNLTIPVITRPIRILPVGDTQVSVLIDPSKFLTTEIADVPDANLGPLRGTFASIGESVLPLTHKQPGESIRAEDFNHLASSIRDIALAVTELTRLVSPVGHNHAELETKFDEVDTNFTTLLNSLSAAMTELQRQIQARRVRDQVEQVLSAAEVAPNSATAQGFLSLVEKLEATTTDTPVRYGRVARDIGVQLQTNLEQLIDVKAAADPQFVERDSVKTLSTASDLLKTQRSTSYDDELAHHRLADRTLGGGLNLFSARV
jgi:hypothetical protein